VYVLAVLAACFPYDGTLNAGALAMGPSVAHPLGTDALGRDVALRLFGALRPLVFGGGLALAVALALGVPAGAIAGARGGVFAVGVRGVASAVSVLPALPLTLLMGLLLGHGVVPLGLAWGLASAPAVTQAVYQRVDALRRADRLLALVTHGVPEPVAVARHLVWNNAADVLRIQCARILATFLAMETALSYLGRAGVAEPAPSWGNMLAMAMGAGAARNPLAVAAPVFVIGVVGGALWWAALGRSGRPAPADRWCPRDGAALAVAGLEVSTPARALVHLEALRVPSGSVTALLGASGTGKSLLLRAIAGILPPGVNATGDVSRPGLAWVAQDGRESLDPLATIRDQVTPDGDALALCGFPAGRLDCFPHTLSGGEAQRAALLAALSGAPPALLLADEPTTGLDPRARRDLTRALHQYSRRPEQPSVVFVTHDRRLLPGFADAVVEIGPPAPRSPDVPRRRSHAHGGPLVDARGVDVYAGLTRRPGRPVGAPVVRGLDLAVAAGETVGIIGESGVGKTTLLRALAGLCASQGALSVLGADPRSGKPDGVQLLWQDPSTSLDPAMTLHALLDISARLGGKRSVKEALSRVALTHRADALTDELSGGERRRASIAQVWLAGARLVLADEPTAALDAPRAAEALTLLQDLVGAKGGIVIASHDLDLVLPLCDRVYVLHEGACVDVFTPESAAAAERHPFTRALMEAG